MSLSLINDNNDDGNDDQTLPQRISLFVAENFGLNDSKYRTYPISSSTKPSPHNGQV